MKVDFKGIYNNLDRYKIIISETEQAISLLETQISKLAENSQTQIIISELKKSKSNLEDILLQSKKMKATLIKVMEIYTKCEEELEELIEGGNRMKFDAFRRVSLLDEERFAFVK